METSDRPRPHALNSPRFFSYRPTAQKALRVAFQGTSSIV
jgi:hypothetical protein